MPIAGAFWGTAVGDALGVPVEFLSRSQLEQSPVAGMRGYGTHFQPPGTWSDDSSLFFCLAEMLCAGYSVEDLAARLVAWYRQGYWTPHGEVFDVGISTRQAIIRLSEGVPPLQAGDNHEQANGNGALMRILPLLFYIRAMPLAEQWAHIQQVSALTHRHVRSAIACFYYLQFAQGLLSGADKETVYEQVRTTVPKQLADLGIDEREVAHFERLLGAIPIGELAAEAIRGSGYVVHALEAAIWCLMTTENYAQAVLAAVHLGEDTDTTAAICGGLAGLYYGWETIPAEWLEVLAKRAAIADLIRRFQTAFPLEGKSKKKD